MAAAKPPDGFSSYQGSRIDFGHCFFQQGCRLMVGLGTYNCALSKYKRKVPARQGGPYKNTGRQSSTPKIA